MSDIYKIIWSDESLNNLDSIITYLETNWTKKEIQKFIRLLDKRIEIISKHPLLFPASPKSNNVRKSVLTKQTTIFYRVSTDRIEILSIFDTRQNPDKLKI
jgi:plasmid stabilization system protein ParE